MITEKSPTPALTAERAGELLSYSPETGIFSRKSSRHGESVGFLNAHGYVCFRVDGKSYYAHRLAWLMVHGEWPAGQVDHINGLRTDNRICNLREATNAQNCQNIRSARHHSRSGLLGASFHKGAGKWRSTINVDCRQVHLGFFATAEEAHAAYLKAKAELHPFQTIAGAA